MTLEDSQSLISQFFSWMGQTGETWMPIGEAVGWNPVVIALITISGLILSISFYGIAAALLFIGSKKGFFSREQKRLTWFFGSFLVLCATTYLLKIFVFFIPLFWIYGAVKFITAISALMTFIVFWKSMPRLLELPDPKTIAKLTAERDSALTRVKYLEGHVKEWTDDATEHINYLKEQHISLSESLKGESVEPVDYSKETLNSLNKIQDELEHISTNLEKQ